VTGDDVMRIAERLRQEDTNDSGLYFVQCCRFVKIGISSRLSYRLRGLETSTPFETTVLAVIKAPAARLAAIEREIHQRFAHLRHRGEWFRLENDLRLYIASLETEKAHEKLR
jgi:hypothetical protein